jgi:tetratricopeptide (TPR) repeat protein
MHYPRSVAVTWETTLAELDESAHALLRLLAWLAPDPIPRALFHSAEADEIFATAVAGHQDSAPTSAVSLEEALAALTKYSMVQWTDAANASVQVHRLVQEITRGRLPEASHRFWPEQALQLVNAALPAEPPPNDVRSWPIWEPFQPHVAFVVDQADRAGLAEPMTRLINGLGLFLEAKCVFAEAEPLLRRALAIDEAAYGATHPSAAAHLNNLALLLRDTNRLEEAEPLFRRMVSIMKHFNDSTGHEHPRWRTALANYSGLLQAMGLSQEEIARRLQDVAEHPASRSAPSHASKGL